jgi:hypothetical protein
MPAEARARGARLAWLACALSLGLFAAVLFGRLSYPLLWQDEAETAMFGQRILEYGYPKVHGPRNVIYQFGFDVAMGVNERHDAYIGTTWGHFYFATIGLTLAELSQDLRWRTALMRLPFALAGAGGVLVALAGLIPAFRDRRAQLSLVAAHLLLAVVSVALVLHLREVRYYALVALLSSALFALHARHHAYRRIGFRAWALGTALLLFLLYHTFYVGFLVLATALALDRLVASRERPPENRARVLARELAPLAGAALAALPFVIFFEQLQTARAFADRFAFGPADYARNAFAILRYMARYELLVPALGLGVVGLALARRPGAGRVMARDVAAPVRRFLGILLGVNLLLNAVNPVLYGRYLVVLTPLLNALVLLQVAHLVQWARSRAGRGASPAMRGAVVLLSLGFLAAGVLPKAPDLAGRLRELREPVRGPLDFAIPFLAERYRDTRGLVIATNYESYPLMTYLGSHVIVGLSGANLTRDRGLRPDVVIPRKRWPTHLGILANFLRQGEFERHVLPVLDAHYNTTPELGRWPTVPVAHSFETRTPATEGESLELFLRIDRPVAPAERTGAR